MPNSVSCELEGFLVWFVFAFPKGLCATFIAANCLLQKNEPSMRRQLTLFVES